MTERPPARIAFLGFGLIGGSIAQALRAGVPSKPPGPRSRPHLTAWTPGGHSPAQAVADGMIDDVARTLPEALEHADLVVIAAPPLETVELVARLGSDLSAGLKPAAVVTDVASTKRLIQAAARKAGLRFVGGHPMAGRESSGYGAASGDLFVDRPWIVLGEGADEVDIEMVRWLARACGARPIDMTATTHDALTAGISHVPLVAAAALAEAIVGSAGSMWPAAEQLAASGWASATRLARGDARMGSGIAATNSRQIARLLHVYRDAISGWLELLEATGGADPVALEARFEAARQLLEPHDATDGQIEGTP